jgi:long-subunit fatty acid transport protein
MRTRDHVAGLLAGLVCLSVSGIAGASSGFDSPESGVVQSGRGGTGVARADDPLAAYFNPAALAWMKSGVHLGSHLMFMEQCFTPTPGPTAKVCANTTPFPNPQLAASLRINRNFAIGLAALGPHAVGTVKWPESTPLRYLLVESRPVVLHPTLSLSYAINDKISVGAGFVWGLASINFVNFAQSTSQAPQGDVKAAIKGFDGFVPGFVVGVLVSPAKRLDIGGWFKWQDAISTRLGLRLEQGANVTEDNDAGRLKLQVPMEARAGFRYHHPKRAGSALLETGPKRRDPLAEDLFDIEVNFTWAHNSVVDKVEVRFDKGIAINGTQASVPENADIPHNWRDVFGVRLGTDFVLIPGFLAVRAGGFFETKGQDDAYLNPDFHMGLRVGLGGGVTARLAPVDVSLSYQHTFYGPLDNGGKGEVRALSGDATTGYRSQNAVNGGSLEASLNELALGGTVRF